MFTLLPGGSHLNPHRDPFGGSLRYHLGLSTPNSDNCRIYVDGQPYAWRDGEDVMFDETFVHWVKNETEQTRVILFCDIERPLRSRLLTRLNRWISGILGRATAPQNVEGERVGSINQAYSVAIRGGNAIGAQVKRFKRAYPKRLLNPPPGAGGDPAGHPLSLDLRLIQMPWQPGCHGNFPLTAGRAPLRFLSLAPEAVQFLLRTLFGFPAGFAQVPLDEPESPLELAVGLAQSSLRIDLEMPGQVDHDEQQVANLLAHGTLVTLCHRLEDFVQLLANLVHHRQRFRPVEADLRRALLQLRRP